MKQLYIANLTYINSVSKHENLRIDIFNIKVQSTGSPYW